MIFDVVTLGEAMLRFSVPPGTWLEEANRLDLHIAGAEANTPSPWPSWAEASAGCPGFLTPRSGGGWAGS